MKVALVHDWLVTNAGAEKVLKCLVDIYPHADIFSIVDFLTPEQRKEILNGKQTTTSFIQKLPFSNPHFRRYMHFFPSAIESFDLKEYDLIISSSWAFAKGIKTHNKQLHLCYCYTPIRYAWDLIDEYTKDLSWFMKPFIHYSLHSIRKWDIASLNRVHHFIAISRFIEERINRIYKKDATVIYPPVNTDKFTLHVNKEAFYLTASRLVPYKKTLMIVEAFNQLELPLVVIGEGEHYKKIRAIAKPNISVLGYQNDTVLIDYMQRAKGFVYGAIEDFGIVPVEAMACGTPVISLGKGGTQETVLPNITGVHFEEQTIESIMEAVKEFETMTFDATTISKHAQLFSVQHFKDSIKKAISHLSQTKQL